MPEFAVKLNSKHFVIGVGENTVLSARERALAETARIEAAASAAYAESMTGPTYASAAAGLAATSDGQGFAVDNGNGTVTVYINDGGAAALQRNLATTEFLASVNGAGAVGASQDVEADPGSLLSRFQNELYVTDAPFNAVGDGETNNDAAYAAASLNCLITGRDLVTPAGVFLTTESIPNFHGVKHRGPGRIKRGADTWYITPSGSQVNTIHVSPTGLSSNDGLSVDHPTTLAKAEEIFSGLGEKASAGFWKIHLIGGGWAGTDFVRAFDWPTFTRQVEIYGDKVGGVRQAIIDRGSEPIAWWWLMAPSAGCLTPNIKFKALHFKNWNWAGSSTVGAITVHASGGEAYEEDCLFEDCGYGFWVQGPLNVSCNGDYYRCEIGARGQYHSKFNVGDTTKTANFYNCAIGCDWGRLAGGGPRYANFYNCTIGARGEQNARFETGNIYGEGWTDCLILVRSGAKHDSQGTITHNGTSVTRSTPLIRYESGAIPLDEGEAQTYRHRHYCPSPAVTITGTTSRTLLEDIVGGGNGIPIRLPAYRFWNKDFRFTVKVSGRILQSTGQTTLELSGQGSGTGVVVESEVWTTGDIGFTWEIEVSVCEGGTDWQVDSCMRFSNATARNRIRRINGSTIVAAKDNSIQSFRLYSTATNSATQVIYERITSYIEG